MGGCYISGHVFVSYFLCSDLYAIVKVVVSCAYRVSAGVSRGSRFGTMYLHDAKLFAQFLLVLFVSVSLVPVVVFLC